MLCQCKNLESKNKNIVCRSVTEDFEHHKKITFYEFECRVCSLFGIEKSITDLK